MVRPNAEEPWFRQSDELLDQLRECHHAEARIPGVGGYEDLVSLQRGGQGTVYLARRSKDGHRVALKVFHEDSFASPVTRRRFEREVYLVSRLKHPNIVRLHRWGSTIEGQPFLAMEYVDGVALDEYVAGLEIDEVVQLFVEICDALHHAHRRGVIHRDLKPGNIRVDSEGHVRLLDFGLAKPVSASGGPESWEVSAAGQFLGSLPWSSPEQVRGHPDDIDTRTDVYALGVLLYQCLTASFPYAVDGSMAEVVQNIENVPPARPTRLNPDLAADLETVLLRCLAKEPERRYQTVSDLARDLVHVRNEEPIEARRDGLVYTLGVLFRKQRVASIALLLTLVGLSAATVVTSVQYRRALRAEEEATEALADKRAEAAKVELVNEFLLGSFVGQRADGADLAQVLLVDVIDAAALGIEANAGLTERDDVRADLHVAFAFWYLALPSRLADAKEHAREALRLYREQEEVDDGYLAWALETNASVAMLEGRFREARPLFLDALEHYRRAESHELNLARVELALAHCAFQENDLEGLEPYLVECHEIVSRQLGADDPRTLETEQMLAHLRERLARN